MKWHGYYIFRDRLVRFTIEFVSSITPRRHFGLKLFFTLGPPFFRLKFGVFLCKVAGWMGDKG